MSGLQASILFSLTLGLGSTTHLPHFQTYWESQLSYLYNDDELNNPWHIDLGNIDAGPLGYLGGPNVVTIDSADYCVASCQEDYPDEFCSMYPPEGVPNKPRVVDDWGTKYNITANMITEGIRSIHQRGGKVILAYGGTLETNGKRTGITAQGGGGAGFTIEGNIYANQLAERIYKNIQDWNLDGVDFFFAGNYESNWSDNPGYNAAYHMTVIARLRQLVGSSKTISYSTIHQPFPLQYNSHDVSVIASCHPYLDFVNVGHWVLYSQEALAQLDFFGIPFSKVGVVMDGLYDEETVQRVARLVKTMGMSGINLFSINKENEKYAGEYARMVAEALYV